MLHHNDTYISTSRYNTVLLLYLTDAHGQVSGSKKVGCCFEFLLLGLARCTVGHRDDRAGTKPKTLVSKNIEIILNTTINNVLLRQARMPSWWEFVMAVLNDQLLDDHWRPMLDLCSVRQRQRQ